MKVALISLHRGGMAHYAAMLAHSLRSDGAGVELACFVATDYPDGLLPDEVTVYRYPIAHTMGMRDWGRWAISPLVLRRLWKELVAWAPDIVHINSGHLLYSPLIGAMRRTFPLVYTMHDAHLHPGEWRPYERLKIGPLLRHADRIILHSELIRAQAIAEHHVAAERTAVISCGLLRLPGLEGLPVEEQPNRLLLPGRIHAYKGYEIILRALPIIAEVVPDVHLTIAGAGNIEPWLSQIDEQSDRVTVIKRFLSETELLRLMQESGLVVLPYIEASQSGVALLASSCGKAVVASRVGSVPEVVEHGETGLLVEPGDPRALADAVVQLLRDPARRTRMGLAARTLNEKRYGPSEIGRRLRALYKEVVDSRGGGTPR